MKTKMLLRHLHPVLAVAFTSAALFTALPAQAQLAEGREQFDQEHYEEALPLLRNAQGPEARRLLGMTYFYLQRDDDGRPLLEAAYAADPSDRTVATALVEILLSAGEADRASEILQAAAGQAPLDAQLLYLAGRLEALRGNDTAAIERMQAALEANPKLLPKVSRDLAKAYLRAGKPEQARAILAEAGQSGEGFEARCLEMHFPGVEQTNPRPWSANVAYQLQHDSNVVLLPDVVQPSGKSDSRHVLTADGSIKHALNLQWTALGEAHAYTSKHRELDQFDQARLNLLAGLAWSRQDYGVRLPVEATSVSVDSDRVLRSNRFTPGAYLTMNKGVTAYGYIVQGNDDYELPVFDPAERRSGSVHGRGGAVLVSLPNHQGELRAVIERTSYDTDGHNWTRAEKRYYLRGSIPFGHKFSLAGAVDHRQLQFDHLNSVYLVRRDDTLHAYSLSATYDIDAHLQVQGAYIHVNSNSTIELYGYDRTVTSLGVSWRF